MAGRQSAFITGANARIKIGGAALAYATDVNYSITIPTIPIETMGTYEVRDNVAVGYQVVGGFSIVKYTAIAAQIDPLNPGIPKAHKFGNQPSQIPATTLGDTVPNPDSSTGSSAAGTDSVGLPDANNANDFIVQGSINDHINPAKMLESATFDIDIYQKLGSPDGSDAQLDSVFKLMDCRIVKRDMQLDKRGIYIDRFTFVAILAGDTKQTGEVLANPSAFKDLE